MAGGLNEKTRSSGDLAPGNLLEFGFEIAPDKMNETGRAMLFNSIVYIAKFTQDRPIAHVPLSAVNRLPAGRSCPAGPPTKECPSRCWRNTWRLKPSPRCRQRTALLTEDGLPRCFPIYILTTGCSTTLMQRLSHWASVLISRISLTRPWQYCDPEVQKPQRRALSSSAISPRGLPKARMPQHGRGGSSRTARICSSVKRVAFGGTSTRLLGDAGFLRQV